jgi:carboxypeptidase Taq
LIDRVTGSPLTIDPFVRYIRHKYGEFYVIWGIASSHCRL